MVRSPTTKYAGWILNKNHPGILTHILDLYMVTTGDSLFHYGYFSYFHNWKALKDC